jgi:hypothetical protein
MEVGLSGGPEKNQVYGLSNITAEKLVGGQYEEFMALKK